MGTVHNKKKEKNTKALLSIFIDFYLASLLNVELLLNLGDMIKR